MEVIHSAVGTITESDVLLSSASSAIILGFHTRIDVGVADLAKREGVQIKLYSIIYELIDQVKEAMAGLLEPVIREIVIGRRKSAKIFELSKAATWPVAWFRPGGSCAARPAFCAAKGLFTRGHPDAAPLPGRSQRSAGRHGMRHPHRRLNDMQPGDAIECFTIEKVAPKLP